MYQRKIFIVLGSILIGTLTFGCSHTKVTRQEIEETIDLSGRWNDTDSRLTSEEIIQDCLNRSWLDTFVVTEQRNPIMIVGLVANRSHEHINARLFVKDLERSLLNSGMVDIVASAEERINLRQERDEQQQGYTDEETIKEIGKETGADYMLQGSINSIKDEIKGKYVILYQVNLELIDLTTNKKVWIGQKQIKKTVGKNKYSL